jgi:hypothetical protein
MAKLSKSELGPLAREVLELLLSGGDALQERASIIAAESVSNQIDYIEAIRTRASEGSVRFEPDNIYAMFHDSIDKIVFNNKVNKFLKAIFDCIVTLGGDQSDIACLKAFMALMRRYESDNANAKNGLILEFSVLSEVRGFVRGFDLALISDVYTAEMGQLKSLWMPLVPELAARSSIPLSKESMLCLISIIDSEPYKFPASVRLSRQPLSMAAGLSVDVVGQPATGVELAPAGESRVQTDNAKEVAVIKYLPEISSLLDGFSSLVTGLSESFENRLAAQCGIIEKLGNERADLVANNDAKDKRISSLFDEKSRLEGKLSEGRVQLDNVSSRLEEAEKELGKYIARHDAIIESSEAREREAVLSTKRELVEKQLSILVSIRDCLSRLVVSEVPDRSALQAASNFNNFLRFLRHEKYLSPDQISGVDIPDGSRST